MNQTVASFKGKVFELRPSSVEQIYLLKMDLPGEKVNKLNAVVMTEFEQVLQVLEEPTSKEQISAVILFSAKSGFIAGADLEMIQTVSKAEDGERLSADGQALMNRWEDLPFPTIAAIHGAALGGGFEFGLASTAIVASQDESTRLGLPEVQLGLLPGMGGTIRSIRKVGLASALDLILAGKNLTAERAFKAGWIEAILPRENFLEATVRWCVDQKSRLFELHFKGTRMAREPKLGGSGGALGRILEGNFLGRGLILKKAIDGVLAKTRGKYPAPVEVIQVVRDLSLCYGLKLRGDTRTQAMGREARAFGKLSVTEESRNLIRLFFMTEAIKKSSGVKALEKNAGVKPLEIQNAAVLGAGVMGGGIAQLLADKGQTVRMKDLSNDALALGVQAANRIFQKQFKRKRISKRQWLQKISLIAPTTDYSSFKGIQGVIEAIVENMEVKKKVLSELEGVITETCVIASNTSSLSVTEMQKALKRPDRFGGMHFFNPVSQMPLVEVIRGEQTSDLTVATLFAWSKRLGKYPIVVKDSPGFLVNRLLMPYLNEAGWLVAEGVSIQKIDSVLEQFGMPMGPIELVDEVGIDVGEKVAKILNQSFGSRFEPCPLNHKMLELNRLGKKNKQGFYDYQLEGETRLKKVLSESIYGQLGLSAKTVEMSDEEILERCIFAMINEAARCLEEKVVEDASTIDLGMIMGTGFPPFLGGVLRYADSVGLDRVVKRLAESAALHPRLKPSEALLQRARVGQKFYEQT